MPVTVEELRKLYPNPKTENEHYDHMGMDDYCVGGALCLFRDKHSVNAFPLPNLLYVNITEENPLIPPDQAIALAMGIIVENDAHRFEEAWKLLGKALSWKPGDTECQR